MLRIWPQARGLSSRAAGATPDGFKKYIRLATRHDDGGDDDDEDDDDDDGDNDDDENDVATTKTPKKRKERCENGPKPSENNPKRSENGLKTIRKRPKMLRCAGRRWVTLGRADRMAQTRRHSEGMPKARSGNSFGNFDIQFYLLKVK